MASRVRGIAGPAVAMDGAAERTGSAVGASRAKLASLPGLAHHAPVAAPATVHA